MKAAQRRRRQSSPPQTVYALSEALANLFLVLVGEPLFDLVAHLAED